MENSFGEFKYGNIKPSDAVTNLAKDKKLLVTDKKFQEFLDEHDDLKSLRNLFYIPNKRDYIRAKTNEDVDCIPFCNHSLGLQPAKTGDLIRRVLESWRCLATESRFSGYAPAAECESYVIKDMANLVGAYMDEVTVMNGLTVNIHLLVISFYEPTEKRNKILVEEDIFSSDLLAIKSQIQIKGLNPEDCLVFLKLRQDERTWRKDDILELIENEGDQIALVLLPSVQFRNGQLFDIKSITETAHSKGCLVGFDLAHAVGNVEIYLHNWNVDFAFWCNYKYMNSGCGAISGCFLHRNRFNKFPKLIGWWGQTINSKLAFSGELDLCKGIAGYRVTNPSPLLIASLRASLDVFNQTNIRKLREKSFLLTGYLECLLNQHFLNVDKRFTIKDITPLDFNQRGCQFSLKCSVAVSEVCDELHKHGVICDTSGDMLRVSPVPLYNTFADVFNFVNILRDILNKLCHSSVKGGLNKIGASNVKTYTDKTEAEEFIKETINSAPVVLFLKYFRPYCIRAKRVFNTLKVEYKDVMLSGRADCQLLQDILLEMTGKRRVPRVFIHQKCVGGCNETVKLKDKGKLVDLVNKKSLFLKTHIRSSGHIL